MKKGYLALALCVTLPTVVAKATDTTPVATFAMGKGYDKGAGLAVGTAQFYDYSLRGECTGFKRLYKFSPITGKQASKPAPAGQPLVLFAHTTRYTSQIGTSIGPGVSVNGVDCENRVRFTPVAGETYDVLQSVKVGQSCTLSVQARSTGAPPPDLTVIDPAVCMPRR